MTIEYVSDAKDKKAAITICGDKLTVHIFDGVTAEQIGAAFTNAKLMLMNMTVTALPHAKRVGGV